MAFVKKSKLQGMQNEISSLKSELEKAETENKRIQKILDEVWNQFDQNNKDYDAYISSLRRLIPLSKSDVESLVGGLRVYNSTKNRNSDELLYSLNRIRNEVDESDMVISKLVKEIESSMLKMINFLNMLYSSRYGVLSKYADLYPDVNKDGLQKVFELNASFQGKFREITQRLDLQAKNVSGFRGRPWTELPVFIRKKTDDLIHGSKKELIRQTDNYISEAKKSEKISDMTYYINSLTKYFDEINEMNEALKVFHDLLPSNEDMQRFHNQLTEQNKIIEEYIARLQFVRKDDLPPELKDLQKHLQELYIAMANHRRVLINCLARIPGGNFNAVAIISEKITGTSHDITRGDFKERLTEDDFKILDASRIAYSKIIVSSELAVEDLNKIMENFSDSNNIQKFKNLKYELSKNFNDWTWGAVKDFNGYLRGNYGINLWIWYTLGDFPLWMKKMRAGEVTDKVAKDVADKEIMQLKKFLLQK